MTTENSPDMGAILGKHLLKDGRVNYEECRRIAKRATVLGILKWPAVKYQRRRTLLDRLLEGKDGE